MRKRIVVLLGVVLLISLLAGCGISKDSEPDNWAAEEKNSAHEEPSTGESIVQDGVMSQTGGREADAIAGNATGTQAVSNAIISQRKMIRNANVTVEVDNFEFAYGKIKTLISAYGFVQESKIQKEKSYSQDGKLITKGMIVIRVDKDKFETALNGIKGLGLLVDESSSTDDITDKYFDTESRLRLLRFEESRLEEYLKKLEKPDDIFKTEKRLTEIRYEIEGLTGTLNKWNDMIALSTITINMVEKAAPSSLSSSEGKGYWREIKDEFMKSIKGVVTFFGSLGIFLAKILPALFVLALFGFAFLFVYRKFVKEKIKPSPHIQTKSKTDNNDPMDV